MKPIITFALLLLATFPALAQTEEPKPTSTYETVEAIPLILRSQLASSQYKEAYTAQILTLFRQATGNKALLTQADIDRANKKYDDNVGRQSAQKLLSYDMDFDGFVTREEIKTKIDENRANSPAEFRNRMAVDDAAFEERRQHEIDNILKDDADGDGKVSLQEAATAAVKNTHRSNRRNKELNDYLALAKSPEAGLSATELENMTLKAFATIDKNNDGMIGPEEAQLLNQQARAQALLARRGNEDAKCLIPKEKITGKLHALAVHEGATASNLSLATQNDDVSIITVDIENGDEPISLILSASNAVIWDIRGAVQRIAHAAVIGPQENSRNEQAPTAEKPVRAAIRGIDRQKVSLHSVRDCQIAYKSSGSNRSGFESNGGSLAQAALLQNLIGQQPASHSNIYTAYLFRISTTAATHIESPTEKPATPAGFDKHVWQKHLEYSPGGLSAFNADEVVSNTKVEPFVVPPAWAGMAKLVYEEALVDMNNAERSPLVIRDNKGNSTVFAGMDATDEMQVSGLRIQRAPAYKIVKDIGYFPAGMHGALSTRFTVAKGVALPKGNRGHSSVTCEDPTDCIKQYTYTVSKEHNPACVSLSACVDGRDFFKIDNGKLTHEHDMFSDLGTHDSCPEGTAVNGRGVFFIDGKATVPNTATTVRIPALGTYKVLRGPAGHVNLAAPNILEINDAGGGAQLYEIDLCPAEAAEKQIAPTP